MNRMRIGSAAAVLAAAGIAVGQAGQAVRVYTDELGAHVRPDVRAPWAAPAGGQADALLWTYNHPIAISESVSISPAGNSAWVGQTLNAEMLQRFEITGPGIPTFEAPGGVDSPAIVAASRQTDLAVFLDVPTTPAPGTFFRLEAYTSAGGAPLWVREFPDTFTGVNDHNLRISRDGSTVVVGLNQGTTTPVLFFLNAADGSTVQTWTGATGTIGSVDVTDDGSRALILHASPSAGGAVIDRTTGLDIFSTPGSGVGAHYQISGDGSVLVMGGFSLHVYKEIGGVYTRVINFTAPGNWFGSASAVSRDGSTVGVTSHNYSAAYLLNTTRIFDVDSASLLGMHDAAGSGSFQGSMQGADMSDDGSRFVSASWGVQGNEFNEVRVFDRTATLIDGIDTAGSSMSVEISGDGRYVLAGSKAVHANSFGNGGNVYLLDLGGGTACYPNCDNSTTAPVLNVADFTCFLQRFAAGESYANCDNSTTQPVLNVADFTCFLQSFAAGCP